MLYDSYCTMLTQCAVHDSYFMERSCAFVERYTMLQNTAQYIPNKDVRPAVQNIYSTAVQQGRFQSSLRNLHCTGADRGEQNVSYHLGM